MYPQGGTTTEQNETMFAILSLTFSLNCFSSLFAMVSALAMIGTIFTYNVKTIMQIMQIFNDVWIYENGVI